MEGLDRGHRSVTEDDREEEAGSFLKFTTISTVLRALSSRLFHLAPVDQLISVRDEADGVVRKLQEFDRM